MISIKELQEQLESKFDLVCFIDLADIRAQHRNIFDVFKQYHRAEYFPSDRLVFYSSYEPEKAFLDHIQRAAARIDISNCFVMIVCPYNITDKLQESNKKFGYDHSVIQSLIVPLVDTKPFDKAGFAKIETLCPLPFSQGMVDPYGIVKPCCKFKGSIGNLNQSNLSQIFSSDQIIEIRNQMRSGKKPQECSTCWHAETVGTISHRQLAMQKYSDLLDQSWLDDVHVRDLSWSPVSLCNFACRICGPDLSSTIAVEEMKWADASDQKKYLQTLIKTANDQKKNIDIIASLDQLYHLNFLHIMGGEPFIWSQLPYLLDRLISCGLSQKIAIEFNTNCSIYPQQHMQTIIANFRAVEILLSVDNVGARFEVERGGHWENALENIKKFVGLQSSKVQIKLAPTVNLQNVLYLDSVTELAEKLAIDIVWSYLESPKFLCIDQATEKTKLSAVEKYLNHKQPELHNIAVRMLHSVGSDGKEFLAYTQKIDRRRSQLFSASHPEIYADMGGCV